MQSRPPKLTRSRLCASAYTISENSSVHFGKCGYVIQACLQAGYVIQACLQACHCTQAKLQSLQGVFQAGLLHWFACTWRLWLGHALFRLLMQWWELVHWPIFCSLSFWRYAWAWLLVNSCTHINVQELVRLIRAPRYFDDNVGETGLEHPRLRCFNCGEVGVQMCKCT